MKTEHKYAKVLRWIADGEAIQWNSPFDGWKIISSEQLLKNIAHEELDDLDSFRLKPRAITVNGREVQAGETKAPELLSEYFLPHVSKANRYAAEIWDSSEFDLRVLDEGLVHLTKEAAIAHAKAMLNID